MSTRTFSRFVPGRTIGRSHHSRRYSDTSTISSSTISQNETPPPRRTVFSGIQPTGIPHLGNYLGAIRQWVKLQNEAVPRDRLMFCIVDLHALTGRQDAQCLWKSKREMLMSLLAAGLDQSRSNIFMQSQMGGMHAELMWILNCHASMGYLERMTQWKSKRAMSTSPSTASHVPNSTEDVRLGLFSYPVLQAADILLYDTTHVPVGEDQAQHVEFTRHLARSFNHAYRKPSRSRDAVFTVPTVILSPAKRIMSLTDPTKKMSKSDPAPDSRILITDPRSEIYRKVRAAKTDSIQGVSYDREARPGVSNLVDLMFFCDESVAASPEELARELKDVSMLALKEKVADTIEKRLCDVRSRYEELKVGDQTDVEQNLWRASQWIESIAVPKMRRIKSTLGLSGHS